jgi:hypothetical protein
MDIHGLVPMNTQVAQSISNTTFDAFSNLCTEELSASAPSKLSCAIIPIDIVVLLVSKFDAFKPGMV